MTQRRVKDTSVRDGIRLIHRRTGLDYNPLIIRYYQERLLKRMELSPYADKFVLKGGFLLYVLAVEGHWPITRPTKEIDFRVQNLPNDAKKDAVRLRTAKQLALIEFNTYDVRLTTYNKHIGYTVCEPHFEVQLPLVDESTE